MPNSKTPREYNHGQQRRTARRDKTLALLTAGSSVAAIVSQLKCSPSSVYTLLKDPEFMAEYDKERELIAVGALSLTASLVESAIATVQMAINAGDGKLAMDFLKETGVLRTTGGQIGMSQKAADNDHSIKVIINVSSDQFDTKPIVKDVEHAISDHNARFKKTAKAKLCAVSLSTILNK